ncbi:putative monooxygenase, partial [Moniliophthora roreri]
QHAKFRKDDGNQPKRRHDEESNYFQGLLSTSLGKGRMGTAYKETAVVWLLWSEDARADFQRELASDSWLHVDNHLRVVRQSYTCSPFPRMEHYQFSNDDGSYDC